MVPRLLSCKANCPVELASTGAAMAEDKERASWGAAAANIQTYGAAQVCEDAASSEDAVKRPLGVHLSPPNGAVQLRTYWWRWTVLLVFVLNVLANNLLWITFAPVADVMRCYYGIDNNLVNTLSLSSAVLTALLVVPSSWLLTRHGIRFTVVLSSAANALGGALRVIGAWSGYFAILLTGQTVSSITGMIMGAVTLLSETWFPPSERVTATAISASVAPQLGVLLGYALSPNVIHSPLTLKVCPSNNATPTSATTESIGPASPAEKDEWMATIYEDILYFLMAQAVASVLIFFLTIFAFPEAPPTPPSLSRHLENEARHVLPLSQQVKEFVYSLWLFVKNFPFMMLLLATGVHIGAAGMVGTVLNELVLPYFPGGNRMISYLGVTQQVSSIVALLIVGRVLDKTKAFYVLWVSVYWLAAIGMCTFAALVLYQHHTYPLYIAMVMLGVSFGGFPPIAFEYAVEITYPLPEGTSVGFINFVTMTSATVLILVFGKLSDLQLSKLATWLTAGLLVVGAVISVFVRPELKRLKVEKQIT